LARSKAKSGNPSLQVYPIHNTCTVWEALQFHQRNSRRLFKAFFPLQVNDIAMKSLLPVLPFPVPEPKPVATTEAMTQMKPISQAGGPTLTKPKVWNTKSLGLRLASDAVSGICAAALVAPVITAVDKSVLQMPLSLTYN